MNKIQIIPLGGLEEIGKNMTAVRYNDELYVIDAGLAFPDQDMLGVDIIIPDFDYLRKNKHLIKGIFITHAHEDHIGALSHFAKEFDVPVYATKLTAAIIRSKMKNTKVTIKKMQIINEKSVIKYGDCTISFFGTNHSIPDSVGVVIETPIGSVVHTGDFKIDYTPLDGKYLDFQRLGEIGSKGVLALLSDSTNATKPGVSISEKKVGENLENVMSKTSGKVIIATFSSSLYRVQNIFDIAKRIDKKVVLVGRSMENNVKIASKLGYLTIEEDLMISVKEMEDYPENQLIVLTTGAQGETLAGLSRMANGLHKNIKLEQGDTVIFSSSPIPGNEKSVIALINQLIKNKVHVVDKGEIHTSGHGNQEEQKLLLSVLRPKYFIPVHGEYRMLVEHSKLAKSIGIKEENIFVCENGDVIEITEKEAKKSEKVKAEDILVDNSGLGDVNLTIMRDRQRLATHGVAVILADFEEIEKGKVRVKVTLKGTVGKYDKMNMYKDMSKVISSKVKDSKTLSKNRKELYELIGDVIYKHVRRKPIIVFEPINLK